MGICALLGRPDDGVEASRSAARSSPCALRRTFSTPTGSKAQIASTSHRSLHDPPIGRPGAPRPPDPASSTTMIDAGIQVRGKPIVSSPAPYSWDPSPLIQPARIWRIHLENSGDLKKSVLLPMTGSAAGVRSEERESIGVHSSPGSVRARQRRRFMPKWVCLEITRGGRGVALGDRPVLPPPAGLPPRSAPPIEGAG